MVFLYVSAARLLVVTACFLVVFLLYSALARWLVLTASLFLSFVRWLVLSSFLYRRLLCRCCVVIVFSLQLSAATVLRSLFFLF